MARTAAKHLPSEDEIAASVVDIREKRNLPVGQNEDNLVRQLCCRLTAAEFAAMQQTAARKKTGIGEYMRNLVREHLKNEGIDV